jgi:hypothetical protein
MYSIPYKPRVLKATEERLNAIYRAARAGLKENAIAYASDMLPEEYKRLKEMDIAVKLVEQKARADAELELSEAMHRASDMGDVKATQFLLTHVHDWRQTQTINVNVDQRISITQALEEAQRRVIDINPVSSTLDAQHLKEIT